MYEKGGRCGNARNAETHFNLAETQKRETQNARLVYETQKRRNAETQKRKPFPQGRNAETQKRCVAQKRSEEQTLGLNVLPL